jgi:hypothetical protein
MLLIVVFVFLAGAIGGMAVGALLTKRLLQKSGMRLNEDNRIVPIIRISPILPTTEGKHVEAS